MGCHDRYVPNGVPPPGALSRSCRPRSLALAALLLLCLGVGDPGGALFGHPLVLECLVGLGFLDRFTAALLRHARANTRSVVHGHKGSPLPPITRRTAEVASRE